MIKKLYKKFTAISKLRASSDKKFGSFKGPFYIF